MCTHSIDDLLPHTPLHYAATGEMVKGSLHVQVNTMHHTSVQLEIFTGRKFYHLHVHVLAMGETFILQFLTFGACMRGMVVIFCVCVTMPVLHTWFIRCKQGAIRFFTAFHIIYHSETFQMM